ncbi:MAG: hypothetical protein EBS06_06710 [Proteobacteria bacterium]|nr:hypothetical protein [Pseudomonadota bacterium]
MKIRLAILFAVIFALNSSASFAKENDIKTPALEPKISTSITKKHKSSLEEDVPAIQGTDLTKVFAEAEKYFKAAQAWEKLKCEPKSGFICTKRECPKREVFTYLILDKKAKTITRCEKDICESFPAEFRQSGVFTNVQTEGPVGTLIRILGDSRYKEITTVGLDAYIANGNCEVIVAK